MTGFEIVGAAGDVGERATHIEPAVAAVLDRRLLPSSPRPVAVALSGGGDSLALLLCAQAWARRVGRRLVVLSVDHRLSPQAGAWTQACAGHAARFGLAFEALAWDGPKPQRGLPAAARAARHALLAAAARAAGARVILLGHTADDVAEARAMRAAGSATPEPREWAPSPAWPEGRGLFLLRPMLGLRRAALRDWLRERGEAWIEDPANADPRFARARARAALQGMSAEAAEMVGAPVGGDAPLTLAAACEPAPGAALAIGRARLREAAPGETRRLAALAAVCAGGGSRLPAGAALDRLSQGLRGGEAFTATLAGARIVADDRAVLFAREAGEAARGGLAAAALPPAEPVVWDGRFELCAASEGLEVRRLAGLAARLPAAEQRALAQIPAAARPALPALIDAKGGISCPLLASPSPSAAPGAGLAIAPLVLDRFRAAAGLIATEPT